jgi:hypothetical protein
MLVIRDAQLALFEAEATAGFADFMSVHVRTHFPIRCRDLGEELTRRWIEGAIRSGQAHGFTETFCLCLFIDLAFEFGPSFASEQPWAVRILADRTVRDERARARWLFEEGVYRAQLGETIPA